MIPAPLNALPLLHLVKEDFQRTGQAWAAFIAPENLPDAAKAFLAADFHLEDVCGLDTADGAVCVYHFAHFDRNERICIRAVAPRDNAVFPSIAPIYQGAEWHERETADFFGYSFPGNPNPVPLLLAEDMAHVHPLKKEESALAPLHILFGGAEKEVIQKAEGFTLMDAPEGAAPKAKQAATVKTSTDKGEGQ